LTGILTGYGWREAAKSRIVWRPFGDIKAKKRDFVTVTGEIER
jgi:hypothetical protein